MILVIGRPGLDERGELQGAASGVAQAAAGAGGRVELVGSVGDDEAGDAVAIQLGRAGIGHAALLRDPAGVTPAAGAPSVAGPLPRLEASDVELGLNYLVDCRVLVVAEWLGDEVLEVATRAAAYHSAQLVVLLAADTEEPARVPEQTTMLRAPEQDGGAFAELVGRYAHELARGQAPAEAWQAALSESSWSESSAEDPL